MRRYLLVLFTLGPLLALGASAAPGRAATNPPACAVQATSGYTPTCSFTVVGGTTGTTTLTAASTSPATFNVVCNGTLEVAYVVQGPGSTTKPWTHPGALGASVACTVQAYSLGASSAAVD